MARKPSRLGTIEEFAVGGLQLAGEKAILSYPILIIF